MKTQTRKPGRLAQFARAVVQSEPVRRLARTLYRASGAATDDAHGYAFNMLLQRHPDVDAVVVAELGRIEADNPGTRVLNWWFVNRGDDGAT